MLIADLAPDSSFPNVEGKTSFTGKASRVMKLPPRERGCVEPFLNQTRITDMPSSAPNDSRSVVESRLIASLLVNHTLAKHSTYCTPFHNTV